MMAAILLAGAWGSLAHADDRDEDIFGAPTPETPPADVPPSDVPPPEAPPVTTTVPPTETPSFLGEVDLTPTGSADIARKLGLADDRLTIGGKLYVRANAYFIEGAKPEKSKLDNPNLLDMFVDARPNDRLRGFAQARMRYDFTVSAGDKDAYGTPISPSSVVLDQLWLKFDVAHRVFFTAGRQRIKWGAGRFWNPTDFMNQQALDPLAVFDERTGVGLIKVHVPIESIGANLYGLGNFEGANKLNQVGGALRTEWVLGPSEVALSAAARKGQPVRLGGDASAGVGPFDLHVEAAVLHGVTDPYYTGKLDFDTFTFPDEKNREDEWLPQVVGGGEVAIKYNDEDAVYVGAEYFYNGAGYDDASLYPWLFAKGAYTPFYTGKHYGGVYVYLPSPGRLDDVSLTASTLANLSDESYVSRLQVSYLALTWLNTYVYGQYHYGKSGEFHYSYDVPESLAALGITIPDIDAPLLDVGLGASIAF